MYLDDLGAYLISIGTVDEGQIFGDYTPDGPDISEDDLIAVLTGYASSPPEYIQNIKGIAYERLNVQVKVRSVSYNEGETLIWAIFDALTGLQNTTLGGTYYRGIIPSQTPFLLRKDDRQRNEFIFNIRVEKAH